MSFLRIDDLEYDRITWIRVDHISSVVFEQEKEELRITTLNGMTYSYSGDRANYVYQLFEKSQYSRSTQSVASYNLEISKDGATFDKNY